MPGYEFTSWMGVAVPAGTPAAIVQRLHTTTGTGVRAPYPGARTALFELQGGESWPIRPTFSPRLSH